MPPYYHYCIAFPSVSIVLIKSPTVSPRLCLAIPDASSRRVQWPRRRVLLQRDSRKSTPFLLIMSPPRHRRGKRNPAARARFRRCREPKNISRRRSFRDMHTARSFLALVLGRSFPASECRELLAILGYAGTKADPSEDERGGGRGRASFIVKCPRRRSVSKR